MKKLFLHFGKIINTCICLMIQFLSVSVKKVQEFRTSHQVGSGSARHAAKAYAKKSKRNVISRAVHSYDRSFCTHAICYPNVVNMFCHSNIVSLWKNHPGRRQSQGQRAPCILPGMLRWKKEYICLYCNTSCGTGQWPVL